MILEVPPLMLSSLPFMYNLIHIHCIYVYTQTLDAFFYIINIFIINLIYHISYNSTRPPTAVPPDEKLAPTQKPTQSPLSTREVRETIGTTGGESQADETKNEALELIYHHSDFHITPIVDNTKVGLNGRLKTNLNTRVSKCLRSL